MVGNYCIWCESICLSSLAKKVEQTDRQTDGHFWDSSSIEVEKKDTSCCNHNVDSSKDFDLLVLD